VGVCIQEKGTLLCVLCVREWVPFDLSVVVPVSWQCNGSLMNLTESPPSPPLSPWAQPSLVQYMYIHITKELSATFILWHYIHSLWVWQYIGILCMRIQSVTQWQLQMGSRLIMMPRYIIKVGWPRVNLSPKGYYAGNIYSKRREKFPQGT
jgi:hypothetical protein